LATSTFAATHFSAVGAALSWTLVEWKSKGKPSVLGTASGMVAGLATITPASGFVTVPVAFCIGLAGGIVCYFAVSKVKARFAYDDSLDVFGVHCVGSIIGMLLLGLTANAAINSSIADVTINGQAHLCLSGGLPQFIAQFKGVVLTLVWSALASFVILKIVQATVGLRVEEEAESMGLDLSQHGESAYND
jgi:Amt family ammonium transporter